jgi:2-oxoglutarate ferredoxin oxidoreductase subunit alpha
MQYLNPMPKNVGEIISKFKRIIVPELNMGQLKDVINSKFGVRAVGYNKMQGLPFKISELETAFMNVIREGK